MGRQRETKEFVREIEMALTLFQDGERLFICAADRWGYLTERGREEDNKCIDPRIYISSMDLGPQ